MCSSDVWSEERATVGDPVGLHLRNATLLVDAAKMFHSEIRLADERCEVDGKSIVQIIALGAGPGADILVRANGVDAAEAVGILKALIEKRPDQRR